MASLGTIITRVYTSDALIPLQDVPVIYTQRLPDGNRKLLAIRMTDGSGLTPPYPIETPDVSASLTPNEPLRPYAEIDISVSYPGYNSVDVSGVQIFPGIQTIQGIQLRPVPNSEANSMTALPTNTQNL